MKRILMPATALAAMKKVTFALVCCAALMLFAAPAWAQNVDQCTPALPVGNATGCGLVITITGTSGHLTAQLTGGGNSNQNPYDNETDDILVGVQNNSTATVGAIVLNGPATAQVDGPFEFDADGPCNPTDGVSPFNNPKICPFAGTSTGYEGPDNTFVGISADFSTGKVLFTTPLAPGASTWFALDGTATSVVAIGENKPLIAGQTTVFSFGTGGVDDYQITPTNSLAGDTMTITPIPQAYVPGQFGATDFPTLNCVPYADFNNGSPFCVEIERDCNGADCATFLYTAQLDFNIDGSQLPNGIGGAHFLGQHDVACPTNGFNLDILISYTGSAVTGTDPMKGGGSGGKSCFTAAFDPNAAPVAQGVTVSNFFGFEFPVSDTRVNPVFPPFPVDLNWDFNNSAGPVTNLHLCPGGPSQNNPSVCATAGVAAPWVYLSLIALTQTPACVAEAAASTPLPSVPNFFVKGHPPLGLLNFGKGEYTFFWDTTTSIKGLKGCQVKVALQFDSGLVVNPATFQYAY